MFKYLVSLIFVVGLASAATFSAMATCDGVTTSGVQLGDRFGASCADGFVMAEAFVIAPVIISGTPLPLRANFRSVRAIGSSQVSTTSRYRFGVCQLLGRLYVYGDQWNWCRAFPSLP
jgi:hypothetical protein